MKHFKKTMTIFKHVCNDCVQSQHNKKCPGYFRKAKCSLFEYRLGNYSCESIDIINIRGDVEWFCHSCLDTPQNEELKNCGSEVCRLRAVARPFQSKDCLGQKHILPFPMSDDFLYLTQSTRHQPKFCFDTPKSVPVIEHQFKPITENVTSEQLISSGIMRIANKRPVTEPLEYKRQTTDETNCSEEPRAFKSADRQKLLWKSDGKCSICGKNLFQGYHADHIIPYSLGGKTEINNGQALCQTCNLSKSNKTDYLLPTDGKIKQELYSQNQYICMAEALKRNGFSIEAAHDIISVCCDYMELSQNNYSQNREVEEHINDAISSLSSDCGMSPSDIHLESNKQIGKFTSLMLPDELEKKFKIVKSMLGGAK